MRLTRFLAALLVLGAPQAARAHDAERGRTLLVSKGCGTCHTIPGVAQAQGRVGPPLQRIATRVYIAGVLPNTSDNLARWLRQPQAIVPGNAMPDLVLDDRDARDIVAYLEQLR